jgi:hypothetical protein
VRSARSARKPRRRDGDGRGQLTLS